MRDDRVLELVMGDRVFEGGWAKPYEHVNVQDAFQIKRQKGCTLSFQEPVVGWIREAKPTLPEPMKSLGKLNAWIMSEMATLVLKAEEPTKSGFRTTLSLAFVDILFKYDNHSHFTYHQDLRATPAADTVVTVVLKLSADKTTLHIAGAECETELNLVGDAAVFLSMMYHRSGKATVRSVLASFFYKTQKTLVGMVQADQEKEKEAGMGTSAAHGTGFDGPSGADSVAAPCADSSAAP
jgi:hypothetical protein